jgi:hypothetical protein
MTDPFTGKYEPDYLLEQRLIDLLRADTEMHALLFSLSPPIDTSDVRIYSAFTDIPERLRPIFPRLMLDVRGARAVYEQPAATQPQGPVRVITHCFVPAMHRRLAQQLDARMRYVFASTLLSTPSIIASGLVPEGQRLEVREIDFAAWRITSQFRDPLVGVL